MNRIPRHHYWGRALLSFLLVLLLMPLGHAMMILMEHLLPPDALHYCAFAMGAAGLIMVIAGVFVPGDTRQTLFGLVGGLLFWTGWVEFLFQYYAWRFGTHFDLVGSGMVETISTYADGMAVSHQTLLDGVPVNQIDPSTLRDARGSKPEYLILPATFGLWAMVMTLYIFCTANGCLFLNWIRRHGLCKGGEGVQVKPMARHVSIVTFMELVMILWSSYLLLMFCCDPVFLGPAHVVTVILAVVCFVGAVAIFRKQLKVQAWGASIRMAIAGVITLWTTVEIMGRNDLLSEIWLQPGAHRVEMLAMLGALAIAMCSVAWSSLHKHRAR